MTIQVDYQRDKVEWRTQPDSLAHAVGELTRDRIGNQKAVAAKMGVSIQYVSRLLSGKETLSAAQLNRILTSCGVSEDERAAFNAWGAREAGWRF